MKEEKTGEFRFNNCKHRSEKEESVTVHRCSCRGGNYTDTGYKCLKRDIFKVNQEICQYCWLFEKK